MYSNISPYLCCNIPEFQDELQYLERNTFKKIKTFYDQFNVNFEPVNISWSENDEIAKNGYLLRLLLHNIENSSPFFICLLGEQYGPHAEEEARAAKFLNVQPKTNLRFESSLKPDSNTNKKQNEKSNELYMPANRRMNWIERNLLIAQKTGYSYIINPITQYNSLLDLQILLSTARIFRKQIQKFTKRKKKEELRKNGPESEYCEFKIKDLKTRLARKGLSIKYYQTLEELDSLIFNDYVAIINKIINNIKIDRNNLRTDILVSNRLKTYALTDSLILLEDAVKLFCFISNDSLNRKSSLTLESKDIIKDFKINDVEETEDYLEILKLRHVNIVNNSAMKQRREDSKSILLLTGPRGCGKTSFMSYLQDNFNSNEEVPLKLFYFLKSTDSMYSIILDIIKQMRLKYTFKDCRRELNSNLYDKKSIIEQFHASLKFGPVVIFIDGLSELETKNILQMDIWLPLKLEYNCKFIFTLNGSSTIYDEIIQSRRDQIIEYSLHTFKTDIDYMIFFAKQLKIETSKLLAVSNKKPIKIPEDKLSLKDQNSHNKLYEKALRILMDLKTARHCTNPLYCQIIAQELFSFDKDIFEAHPLSSQQSERRYSVASDYDDEKITGSRLNIRPNSTTTTSVSVFNSYIEDVCTLRELIQKVIKRYTLKYSWTNDPSNPVSAENPGWIGDALCLISLSLNGISKTSIMSLLEMRGYMNEFKVEDQHWHIFRMLFGSFIIESLNGLICFSHDYFREAVQSLLLDGFFVELNVDQVDDTRSLVLTPKKNLSIKQQEMHLCIILDLLNNKLKKSDFLKSSTICPHEDYDDLSSRYFEYICEILYNLHMLYDLVNMNKILTNYRVLEIINRNRIENLSLWFKCLEFLKILKPLTFFELSLLNNLTIDMPNIEDLLENLQTTSINESPEVESTENIITLETSNDLFSTKSNLQIDGQNNELVNPENYSNLIDTLIDSKMDAAGINKSNGESVNLVLLNRVLLINDLMLHLNEQTFIKTYSMKLCELVNKIVVKNYPLSDNEKYYYAKLLEYMSFYYIRNNEYEISLTSLMKSIEILEDLYHTFEFNNLCPRLKTKKSFYHLSNFLSLQYASMSYILLKISDMNSAQLLLNKAIEYNQENKENLNKIKKKKDNEISSKQKKTRNESVSNEPITKLTAEDDSIYFTAKYYVYLYSALLESQLSFNENANQFFLKSLNLSVKWFGENHSHTSKVYHYYGCYLALKDNKHFNPRKSELFLRKALSICEKYKNTSLTPFDKADLLDSSRIEKKAEQSEILNESKQTSVLLYDRDLKSHYIKERLDNDELSNIATILYDLGCLLNSNKSDILRKEGVSFIRRCLDIKVLMHGANHIECQLIKNQITHFEIQNNNFMNEDNLKQEQKYESKSLPVLRRTKTAAIMTPRDKTLKSLETLRKQIRNEKTNEDMLNWIARNSLIETIKPIEKIERDEKSSSDMLQSSEYIDNNLKDFKTLTTNSTATVLGSKTRLLSSRIPSSYSANGRRPTLRTVNTPHQRTCYIPTAFSVDIHNTGTVHGPHSSVRDILAESLKDKSVFKPHTAILKPIYYKSAWYDRPFGSSKKRFKQFQKLNPNSPTKSLSIMQAESTII